MVGGAAQEETDDVFSCVQWRNVVTMGPGAGYYGGP